jgi:hypothetical protein
MIVGLFYTPSEFWVNVLQLFMQLVLVVHTNMGMQIWVNVHGLCKTKLGCTWQDPKASRFNPTPSDP